MPKTLNVDMRVYSDIELEFFVKELTESLDCIERLSEPDEEYESFDIDITRSPIFFGYTENARKSIDRILNTIYTEQDLRSTLREELMKKLDAYTNAQLADIFFTVSTDIAQHRDLLEMLSEEDGTLFKKDTENYIEKQERYLKLITDVLKKRNENTSDTPNDSNDTGTNNSNGSGDSGSTDNTDNNGGTDNQGSGSSESGDQSSNTGNTSQDSGTNQGDGTPSESSGSGVTSTHTNTTGLSAPSPLASGNPNYGLDFDDPDDDSSNNNDDGNR